MDDFITQVNVIQIAVNNLEEKVKLPKDQMQRTHFLASIGEIKGAVQMLKELINQKT